MDVTVQGTGSAALPAWLVWISDAPLGVPGEWVWSRKAAAQPLWLTLAGPTVAAACYLSAIWLGSNRIGRAGRSERALWLVGLAAAAYGWLWTAQEATPEGYQLSKSAWVLFYPGSSGYFTAARHDRRSAADLRGICGRSGTGRMFSETGAFPGRWDVVRRFRADFR